ncbi:hypothetical protein C4568_02225 [Candidatus Parcubacteria bacterium]|nr:MAG: hypothetical protein C4568_02225 [Candidatus Parcubacteria bacterium]
MDLRSIYNRDGFTLIEILIATGVTVMLFAVGLVLTIGDFHGSTFNQEVGEAIVLLQAARSKAMNNVDGMPHGATVDDTEIMFSQLSGDAASTTIVIVDEQRGISRTISVNAEGRISW